MPKKKEEKAPLSMVIENTGVRPVQVSKNRTDTIVLHPKKSLRVSTKKALELMGKYSYVKEKVKEK